MDIKDQIINELKDTLYILGAKEGLQAIINSYSTTMNDEYVLDSIRAWNKEAAKHPGRQPQRIPFAKIFADSGVL